MAKPRKGHWLALKWVLRYVKGSVNKRLCYGGSYNEMIEGFVDSDFAGSLDTRNLRLVTYLLCLGMQYHGKQVCNQL